MSRQGPHEVFWWPEVYKGKERRSGIGGSILYLPIPLTNPRKWMNVRIKYIERKWFDDFGSFYTYLLENAEVVEVVDEDELVWYVAKSMRDLEVHPDDVQELREQIVKTFGIAEKYVDLILHKVRTNRSCTKPISKVPKSRRTL